MAEARRRLAAILAADVAGYSRLLAEDEAGTLEALRSLRRELFEPAVAEHRGEVIKRMGDGWLIQFGAVTDAVRCAVAIQDAMAGRSQIRLRMGAHLGDVTHEDEDIYGDGINIAARLQTLAEPGDLLLSDDCVRQLDGKTTGGFTDLGAQALKNIDKPVRAWRYRPGAAPIAAPASTSAAPPYPTLLVAPLQGTGSAADFAAELDGELSTALGHIRWIKIGEAAATGPAYELSGAVRVSGERVRVSYRLVDRAIGNQLISRQVDGDTADLFATQERISNEISNVVEFAILKAERSRLPDAADAWHDFIEGYAAMAEGDVHRMQDAIAYLERSIASGIVIPQALSVLAAGYVGTGVLTDHENADALYAAGAAYAERCLLLDPDNTSALIASLYACQMQGRGAETRIKATQLERLAPSHPEAMGAVGMVRMWSHEYREALALFDRAIASGRRSQYYPWFLQWRATALYLTEDYAAAELTARECVLDFPNFAGGHRYLGIALAQLGRDEEARAELQIADRLGRILYRQGQPFVPDDIKARLREGYSKVGMEL